MSRHTKFLLPNANMRNAKLLNAKMPNAKYAPQNYPL